MKKFKQIILLSLVIVLLVGLAYFLGTRSGMITKKREITSTLVEEKLQSVKELTSIKYKYTNVGSFENQSEFYGIKIPLTLKKFIVSYDGVINAGIDLEDSQINVAEKKIIIKLPKSKILSHEIDENSIKIFDEKNSIFNLLEIEDYSNFRKDQMGKVEKEAIEKGLLTEASERTKDAVVDLLNINPIIAEEYEIEIREM